MIKAIIIDDERLARNELKKLLLDFPEIEVIARSRQRLRRSERSTASTPTSSSSISKCR